MGSLRNPIGPLPSTIYWRRRAILLTVFGVLALLVIWVVVGGGGDRNNAGDSDGKNPAPSITPGPSGSGPAISEAPGGRDESGDESTSGGDSSGSSSGSGAGSGSGGSDGGTGTAGAAGNGTSGGGADGSGATTSGEQVPASSGLPNCTGSAVKLIVRSMRNAYDLGVNPSFEIVARNSSGSDCKLDLGPDNTVVTVTRTGADDPFWSSDDCHESAGNLFFRVPAGEAVTYAVEWNRDPSAPNCATPSASSAAAGTYMLEAAAPGLGTARTSFVLKKD